MNLVEYPDREMLAMDLANRLAGELESHLLRHDSASFAVPGGTTPGAVFDTLCAADLDWERVHVFPTDERCVPADHSRSNARLIRERLITHRAARARFLPLWAPDDGADEGLVGIEARLTRELPISVLLLGMGSDMHVASLFPGAEGLAAALAPDAPVLARLRPDGVPEPRISLSARVLDGALSKHLVIYGEEKRAALDRATSLSPQDAPVQAILKGTTIHWAE
ncbi:6-phosphogluconolactonase [Antarcticimicrobium sediminis]|uniref:6-phosphogluconolactonase n=1 Tax=Antarcticimicrobium sediminis TaxID=2546227 RepID=A0A4R5EU94_9RHOB|nr:6-phosphogluconolactonase [Antarcticimicrobium sediminis]TDE38461.1 6-phosphogluconolactonase [Antarcticimicrobium sediminis]